MAAVSLRKNVKRIAYVVRICRPGSCTRTPDSRASSAGAAAATGASTNRSSSRQQKGVKKKAKKTKTTTTMKKTTTMRRNGSFCSSAAPWKQRRTAHSFLAGAPVFAFSSAFPFAFLRFFLCFSALCVLRFAFCFSALCVNLQFAILAGVKMQFLIFVIRLFFFL
jgi:hypothetical protein